MNLPETVYIVCGFNCGCSDVNPIYATDTKEKAEWFVELNEHAYPEFVHGIGILECPSNVTVDPFERNPDAWTQITIRVDRWETSRESAIRNWGEELFPKKPGEPVNYGWRSSFGSWDFCGVEPKEWSFSCGVGGADRDAVRATARAKVDELFDLFDGDDRAAVGESLLKG